MPDTELGGASASVDYEWSDKVKKAVLFTLCFFSAVAANASQPSLVCELRVLLMDRPGGVPGVEASYASGRRQVPMSPDSLVLSERGFRLQVFVRPICDSSGDCSGLYKVSGQLSGPASYFERNDGFGLNNRTYIDDSYSAKDIGKKFFANNNVLDRGLFASAECEVVGGN